MKELTHRKRIRTEASLQHITALIIQLKPLHDRAKRTNKQFSETFTHFQTHQVQLISTINGYLLLSERIRSPLYNAAVVPVQKGTNLTVDAARLPVRGHVTEAVC